MVKNLIDKEKYFSMLSLMAGLSNLFSESDIPFIHYRVTENLFCKYFGAENLSRADTAYDAKWNKTGIGIKTFIIPNLSSMEKIAEFNSLSNDLKNLEGLDLACKLADFRNERMLIANGLYGIEEAIYHIIGRKKRSLFVFNTAYDFIDKDKIEITKNNEKSLHFSDGKNKYSFNRSKSVLMKEFKLPPDAFKIDVDIINDPFLLLENLLNKRNMEKPEKQKDQIILPLFSEKNGIRFVAEKSGLNQWNASGRKRDMNEVYIPVPSSVRKNQPNFFPDRNTDFTLILPDNTCLQAKICQDGGKALMSNPNSALGEWILRKVLHKKPYELVTFQDLVIAGFDSLLITKEDTHIYKMEVSYEKSFSY